MTIIENIAAYERAKEARIKANARKGRSDRFKAEHEDWEALVDFITANAGNHFWRSIEEQWIEWGTLRPKVVEIIRERIAGDDSRKAAQAERDALSDYIGEVGGKIEVEATVSFQTHFHSDFGVVYITGFLTDDNNIIIHKGAQPTYETGKLVDATHYAFSRQVKEKAPIEKGDRVRLKGTVKAHGERNGAKQTIVTRPKVTKL